MLIKSDCMNFLKKKRQTQIILTINETHKEKLTNTNERLDSLAQGSDLSILRGQFCHAARRQM